MRFPSSSPRRLFRNPAAVCTTVALTLTLVLAPPATAATLPPDARSGSDSSTSAGQMIPFDSDVELPPVGGESALEAGQYVVILKDQPAASYTGGVQDLVATADEWDGTSDQSAAVRDYTTFLQDTQREVAESVGAQPDQQFTIATNGFASDLTGEQASRLASDPRVERVVPNEIIPLAAADTSTGYLGLEGPDGIWSSLGGTDAIGDGVVVGVIDTGIAPENPAFAGGSLGTDGSASAPYLDGEDVVFAKSDGGQFRGRCVAGEEFEASDCSTKLIGARYFVDGFGRDNIGDASAGEYLSPRDGDGHGSHTASTAAGNPEVAARTTSISGVTPRAKIAAYKACWSGPAPESQEDDGCATIDLLAAIDAATADGVDVINYSIGGGAAQTTNSAVDQAFMTAAASGIFVAAAAGNSGPAASTLDNAAPWITTVAASTIPAPEGTVILGDGQRMLGTSVTVSSPLAGPVVLSTQAARIGREVPAAICARGSLDPADVTGHIVICDRGTNARTEKSAEVAAAGGIGMILVNPTPSSMDVDEHSVPTVHLDSRDRDALTAYTATPSPTVTLKAGNTSGRVSPPTPQIAGFSSRGPVMADGSDLIKPDIAAPGTTILAATGNPADGEPTFGYLSGTSMASPHVAGLAALYLSQRPTATPAEIKSAIMTSATDTVDADGAPFRDPFAQGNGQVVPSGMLEPGMVYLNTVDDWQAYLKSLRMGPSTAADIDASDLNLPSVAIGALSGTQTVTRTVTSTAAGSYTAELSGLNGVDAIVEPSTLSFDRAGQTATFEITFTRTSAAIDEFTSGVLTWEADGSGTDVRSALAVRPVPLGAPEEVSGLEPTGQVNIPVQFGQDSTVDIQQAGLARGSRVNGVGSLADRTVRYAITAPEGTDVIRADLDSLDDTADLDLNLYYRFPDGGVMGILPAVSLAADEQIVTEVSQAGTYILEVVFRSAGESDEIPYTLTGYALDGDNPGVPFTIDPAQLSGRTGDTTNVTASWENLPSGAYFGLLGFGDTGVATMIAIDAGTTPATPGTPSVQTSPSAEEWLLDGEGLRVTGTGLTPGATYTARIDGTDPVRSGTANEDGQIDWIVPTGAELPTGIHELRFQGPQVDTTRTFRTSPVVFSGGAHYTEPLFSGETALQMEATPVGEGTVRFEVQDTAGQRVFVEEVVAQRGLLFLPSSEIPLPAGAYTGSVTALLSDGSDGASFDFGSMTVAASEASSIALSEPDSDGHAIVTVNNKTAGSEPVYVTYTSCDGTRIIAHDRLPLGESSEEWNTSGARSITVGDRLGKEILRWNSTGDCDQVFGDPMGQEIWSTFRSAADPVEDPTRPIVGEVAFRTGELVEAYGLLIGTGNKFVDDPFLRTTVFIDPDTIPGTVSRTPFTFPENTVGFASVSYTLYSEAGETFISEDLFLPAMTRAELLPDAEVITAGVPVITGTPRVGHELTVNVGTWSPGDLSFSYHWMRDGELIAEATSSTYTATSEDGARRLSVRVTGTTPTGASTSAISDSVTIASDGVDPRPDSPTVPGAPSDPNRDGGLAHTGAALAPSVVAAAVVLLLLGAILVWARRRSVRKITD